MFKAKHNHWPIQLKLAIIGFILYVIWIFNRNFSTPLLLGLILATLTYPIYDFYLKKVFNFLSIKTNQMLSGITTMVLVLGIITIILNIVAAQLIREIPDFADSAISFAQSLPNNKDLLPYKLLVFLKITFEKRFKILKVKLNRSENLMEPTQIMPQSYSLKRISIMYLIFLGKLSMYFLINSYILLSFC
jgi:predicted PurR-regulated permease PerM